MSGVETRQVWLVTGASRGLGRAIVDGALDAGHLVVATVRGPSQDLEDSERLLVCNLDVTGPSEQHEAVVRSAVDRFGRVDVLVNNAGYGLLSAFEETGEEQARAVFETNVFGLMRTTRAVLPVMRRQRAGRILNISSSAGYGEGAGGVLYNASKYAVRGFSVTLGVEVAPFGIKVTSVAPGLFRSDFLDPSSVRHDADDVIADYDEIRDFMAGVIATYNHTQPGDPAALARLLVDVAASDDPPRHLPVGADAVNGMDEACTVLGADVDAWRARASATAYPQD